MSDWYGVVYREVLPQGQLKAEPRRAQAHLTKAAGSTLSSPRSPPPHHHPVSTRMPYTESIYDAQQVVCASDGWEQRAGECE